MKLFFILMLLVGIGIGLCTFYSTLDSVRPRMHCDGRYAKWLMPTPDKTLLASRKNSSGLPDSLVDECESSIIDGHVLSEQHSKLIRLSFCSTLLLIVASIVGIARSRIRQ